MKKLLIILGSVSIFASSGSTAACSWGNKYKADIVKDVQDYIAASSFVAQAAILNNKDGANMDLDYTASYIKSLKIVDVLGEEWIKGIGNSTITKESSLEFLLKQVFGNDRYKVNKDDLEQDSKIARSMAEFDEEAKQKTLSGNSSTAKTLSLISGLVNILFGGSSFTPQGQGALLESIIGSGDTIGNLIKGILTPQLIETLDSALSEKGLINLLKQALKEIPGKQPGQEYVTVKDAVNSCMKQIIDAIIKKDTTSLVVPLIQYIRVLAYYMSEFKPYLNNVDVNDVIKTDAGFVNIFDMTKTNSEIVSEVLLKNDGKINEEKFDQINFKELFSFLQIFLVPEQKDRNGINFQKLISILFQTPSIPELENPFFGALLTNLKDILQTQLATKLASSDAVNEVVGLIIKLLKDIGNAFANQGPLPGKDSLKIILKILGMLGIESLKPYKPLFDYLNTNSEIFDNLLGSLYSGNALSGILKALNDGGVIKISDEIINSLTNIKTVLTTPIAKLLKAFGIDIETKAIFLYGLKTISLADIIDSAASFFETGRKYPNSKSEYILDTKDMANLLDVLNTPELIKWKDKPIEGYPEIFNNTLSALLVAIVYPNDIELTEESPKLNGISKASYILGLRKKADNTGFDNFKENSVYDAIYQAYGNKELPESPMAEIKGKTMSKMANLLIKVSKWIQDKSLPAYVNDKFGDYLDQKNWTTKFLSEENFYYVYNDAFIKYELYYNDKESKTRQTYIVTIKRDRIKGHENPGKEWKVYAID
ncbi:MOLPALP family lipoprotein [Mesoplasma syrphidae]|uniref:MOLPALP family lipoprotein n=1 Tax=Mesoplasma syrphidae TaxID=225999 RepID=A0A2K9BNK7_9MOLU|nr:MOLPALP family lipoprotein [Mesoplasma syrphidae]AUF83623.1 MOLPALP family lipoprotein [Mesoplasma syrphidae]